MQVVVYTRQSCPLCDVAWESLQKAQMQYHFHLRAEEVDRNAELLTRYGECVPVVVIGGQVRFRGQVNEILLTRILRAEQDRIAKREGG